MKLPVKALHGRDEIYPLIASLIRAERTHRQARSISYRIGGAKFPVLKDIDKFVFADTPVDEGKFVSSLPAPSSTPSAMRFSSAAPAPEKPIYASRWPRRSSAPRQGRFFNLVDLVNQLEQEKAAGRSGRLSEKLLRYDVIVIDELAICRSASPAPVVIPPDQQAL